MRPAPHNKARQGRYHDWYNSPRWRSLRAAHLAHEPWCRMCHAEGHRVRATVCDHVTPHRGDERAFWAGPFQSLCDHHHSREKQGIEVRGYSNQVGPDGLPLDGRHPFFAE